MPFRCQRRWIEQMRRFGRRPGILEDELKILRINNPKFYEKTQQIGDIAKNLGYEAIIYPSVLKDRGKSIVIFKKELLK